MVLSKATLKGAALKVGSFAMAAYLVSCTCNKQASENKSATPSDDKVTAVDFARKAISVNMIEEPRNMDQQKMTDTVAIMVATHVFDGLMRLDPGNKPIPAVAESYELKTPSQYVFKIRPTAKWSDGQPVKAEDFVFAWQRAVDPKTASEYAFFLYRVKNGEAINQGKKKPEELGVRALDEKTLEVNLEGPTAYFLSLTAFPTLYPTRKDIYEKYGETYAAEADKMVFNGPFTLAEWKHNASMKMTKNEQYWNKDAIALNEINMPYLIKDENSEYNMFKDGKYALTNTSPKEVLPDAQANNLQIKSYNPGAVWYFQFNTARKVTGNKNLRKAISYALDRNEYSTKISGIPGVKPMYGLIPSFMPGLAGTYGEDYGNKHKFQDNDVAKAKEYLAKAKKELGVAEIPTIQLLINDTAVWRRDAEYYQRTLKEKLGINLQVDIQTFKVRLDRTQKKDFDITLYGWGPDYMDPMTFGDLMTSWNANNNSSWASKSYDDLIRKAMNSVDQKERMEAFFAAEKVMLEDLPLVPIFENARLYFQDARLTGVLRQPVGGDPNFYYARLVDKVSAK